VVALIALTLTLTLLGGLGFAIHDLSILLAKAITLPLRGLYIGAAEGGGHGWCGRS
jgi:hypothetical protein